MLVTTKNWIAPLALVWIIALAVVACGGNGDVPSAPPPQPTAAVVEQPTAAVAEQPTAAMTPSDGPFRVGVMESLTGPGETYGTVSVQAKQMAVDEINAAGGINGRMLELIVEDSKCSAQDAITAYNKLTDVDGVKIILGTSCSGAMLGAAPRWPKPTA